MNAKLYFEAISTEKAWADELTRLFGAKAVDARYDKRGTSTDALKSLYERWQRAEQALLPSLPAPVAK